MRYITVPKKAYLSVAADTPSFWDVSKWPEWWNSGATTLEKSAPGKVITAPIRILESATDATTGTLKEVPKVVDRASMALPFIGVAAALAGAGFLAYRFGLFNKKEKQSIPIVNNQLP